MQIHRWRTRGGRGRSTIILVAFAASTLLCGLVLLMLF
jgi:hypothetical protein